MGWAKDAFENELARSGIFPIGESCTGRSGYSSDWESVRNKESSIAKKKKTIYYKYEFPTEAQARTLGFITSSLGVIFEGKTKDEARLFINKYIEMAREV